LPIGSEQAFDTLLGVGTWHDPNLGRPIAVSLERYAELLGIDLATICQAVANLVGVPSLPIRKELWRQTGHRIEAAGIVRLLTETFLRPASSAYQPATVKRTTTRPWGAISK
jgi:hypothetical protein